MFTSTLLIFAFFAITFWLTVELINYLWIGGQPMFPTDILVKLIKLPLFPTDILVKLIKLPFLPIKITRKVLHVLFFPIKITRKVLHVLFFPFKTVLHTFLK